MKYLRNLTENALTFSTFVGNSWRQVTVAPYDTFAGNVSGLDARGNALVAGGKLSSAGAAPEKLPSKPWVRENASIISVAIAAAELGSQPRSQALTDYASAISPAQRRELINAAAKSGEGVNFLVVDVEAGASSANGVNLMATYAAAKQLLPNGQTLSATNPAWLILPPGAYALPEIWDIDSSFVNIVALVPYSVTVTGTVNRSARGNSVDSIKGIPVLTITNLSGNVIVDRAEGSRQTLVLTGAVTLLPFLGGYDGQELRLRLKASGADRTVSLDAAIRRPSLSGSTWPMTLTSGKAYNTLFVYNESAWELVSFVGGY